MRTRLFVSICIRKIVLEEDEAESIKKQAD